MYIYIHKLSWALYIHIKTVQNVSVLVGIRTNVSGDVVVECRPYHVYICISCTGCSPGGGGAHSIRLLDLEVFRP
jgi:hypothetical protein